MNVLTVNAGSSTLKLAVVAADDRLVRAETLEGDGSGGLDAFAAGAGPVGAVAHRLVHGGDRFTGPTLVTGEVVTALRDLVPLAPLHQPRALDALDAVTRRLPDVPAVACFDTAFHTTLPPEASAYAVPAEWRRRWPVRRYGFHGLSHAGAARRAGELSGGRVPWRVVSCHLGAGASLCAVRDGRSIDTTMGFTPLEGLVMATRSGTVDPGLVLWLVEQGGLAPAEVREGLESGGGLAALAGVEGGDLRAVPRDSAAYAVWRHRLVRELGAMVAVLGGVDAVVFTGGIGEHQPAVRADVAGALAWLGAVIDPARNEAPPAGGGDVAADSSSVRLLVVPAREDLEMARQTRGVLAAG